jgi:non-heme chloroperoxidase
MLNLQSVKMSDGVALSAKLIGEGETTLVFTSGWSFGHGIFERQIDALSRENRCLFYDPRGQGASAHSLKGNHYARHGQDLSELIAAFELRDVVLVSWSYGVLAAYSYIRQFGVDNVKGFVCIDESPKPMSEEPDAWCTGSAEVMGEYLRVVQDDHVPFLKDYAGYMVSRPLSEDERDWIVAQGSAAPPHVAAALFADGHFSDFTSEAQLVDQSIPCMTFVREDWSSAALAWIANNTPNTQTSIFPSHLMFWECPDKFNAELVKFVNDLKPEQVAV